MECVPVCEENRGIVKLAIMVEAGSVVTEMGMMTKEWREGTFYEEYMNLLSEIPDKMIGDETVRKHMMQRFKGMRRGEMDAGCLLHKYETEMTALKKISLQIPRLWELE
jgi:hypothetical protein